MAYFSGGSVSLYQLPEDPREIRRFLELHGTPAHKSTWGIPLTVWREYNSALHARTSSTSILLELNMLDEQDVVDADQQELQEFLTLQQNEAAVAVKPRRFGRMLPKSVLVNLPVVFGWWFRLFAR
ncbi:hypothetical protein F5051DRAFT_433889 [Lentinula edodes]|nr:hypothetical protein F5051DRAFT_433889 [Lentinula edodes]